MVERHAAVIAVLSLVAFAPAAHGQPRYIAGVFVSTPEGITELMAYAELSNRGRLEMTSGDLEDAPLITQADGMLASLPLWTPIRLIVATTKIFDDERAERRELPFSVRKRNISTIEVFSSDLKRRERIDALLKAVRASGDTPGYAFLVLAMDGALPRYYPVRLSSVTR